MRLIDAKQLEKQVKEVFETINPVLMGQMLRWIRKQKTIDAVPVVRCRECKKHYEFNGEHYCKFWRMYCPDDSDFFCKAGERKEGAN